MFSARISICIIIVLNDLCNDDGLIRATENPQGGKPARRRKVGCSPDWQVCKMCDGDQILATILATIDQKVRCGFLCHVRQTFQTGL